jgi:hypothetical protein
LLPEREVLQMECGSRFEGRRRDGGHYVKRADRKAEELRKDAQNSMFVIEFEVCGRHNPPQGDKGPNRVATVLSKQTLASAAATR